MIIWFTSTPKDQDFPIWAYVDDENDVVLIRTLDDLVHEDTSVIWTHARIPAPPVDHVDTKFQQLSENQCNMVWGNRDWFRAGYNYGLTYRDISEPNKKPTISSSNEKPSISSSNTGWKS